MSLTVRARRFEGFARSADRVVFLAARMAGSVILSKDSDFCDLQRLLGPPPKIIWLRCRNRSNDQMKEFLFQTLGDAITLLKSDDLVEIRDLQ